jgi:hypothetical protein
MRVRVTTIASAGLVTAAASTYLAIAFAHHGGAVEWRQQDSGPITGTVTKFAFQFPHVYVSVDVPEASGEVTRWTLVTRWTPTILREHGWTRDSIEPGDTITVTYWPHIEQPRVGSIQTIEVNGESLPIDF